MAPVNFIALPRDGNIIDEIANNLISEKNDYSSNIIIFPNKRPSHFLRRKLALMNNTSFIPPVIYSIDEFIDHIYDQEFNDVKLDSIDSVAYLYKLHKESENPLGGEGFLELDSFLPLGLKIFNDIEELYIENISVNQVKNIDQFINDIPPHTSSRLQNLSFFYNKFYKTIEKSGYSTRSWRYIKTAKLINKYNHHKFKQIILAGFFALTKAEIEIFKVILSWDNSLLIFKEGLGIDEKLKEISIEYKSSTNHDKKNRIFLYSSPDSHGQIFALSRLIKGKLDNGIYPDEKNLILTPSSDNLIPLIHGCLSVLSPDAYNISMGYPLFRTPLFGFLNNLMELILSIHEDKVYLPNYIKFVLHPYTKNILLSNQAELTRIIFHTIEEELSKNRAISFMTLEEIEENEKIISHIVSKFEESGIAINKDIIVRHLKEIHQNTIGRFKSFKNIEDFANKCLDLLTYIYENSTARLHALFYPFSEAFLLAVHKLSKSLIKELSFTDLNGYFIFFKKYLLTCNVPFEGTPIRGLQVLGFLETRNLNFQNIYMIDVNEGILPSLNDSDSLIPFVVRKGLGLPTYLDSDKITEYYFETLLYSADEVHIFYIENDKTERSRFIEMILWQRQKKESTLDEKDYIRSVQYKIDLKKPILKEIVKTEKMMEILKQIRYTSSSLDTYLRCALAFYYSYVLRIRKKEGISGEIEKSDIGIFLHNVLGSYFRKIKGEILGKKNLSIAPLEKLLESMCKREFGQDLSGSAYLIKRQLQSRLIDLIREYYLPLSERKEITIIDTEHEIQSSLNSYQLYGRLDSIEKRGDKIFIIDYKTSASEINYKINFHKLNLDDRDSWQESIGSIQLPFYMLLYSEHKKVDISSLEAIFLLLGKNVINEEIEMPFCDDKESISKCYETMKEIILRILDEINNIEKPFIPPKDLKKACEYCDYKKVCGI